MVFEILHLKGKSYTMIASSSYDMILMALHFLFSIPELLNASVNCTLALGNPIVNAAYFSVAVTISPSDELI